MAPPAPPPAPLGPLTLVTLPGELAVTRLAADAPVPRWAAEAGSGVLWSITRTPDELSIVCAADAVPAQVTAERGWRALRVAGTIDLALTGILASVLVPLAHAGISIFAVSTYDTDYVLLRESAFERGLEALRAAGHEVVAALDPPR